MTNKKLEININDLYLTKEEIEKKVAALGKQITKDFYGEELVVVCILKGAFVFTADLCRQIDLTQRLDFMAVSSYGDEFKSSGNVRIDKDITEDIEGKNVLIVEDIIDSGLTLSHVISTLEKRNPKTIKICVLCNKPSNQQKNVTIDYCGFKIENDFIVGYGLDKRGYLRNLPYIGTVKK